VEGANGRWDELYTMGSAAGVNETAIAFFFAPHLGKLGNGGMFRIA